MSCRSSSFKSVTKSKSPCDVKHHHEWFPLMSSLATNLPSAVGRVKYLRIEFEVDVQVKSVSVYLFGVAIPEGYDCHCYPTHLMRKDDVTSLQTT